MLFAFILKLDDLLFQARPRNDLPVWALNGSSITPTISPIQILSQIYVF